MTEGRGPMVPKPFGFNNKNAAIKYTLNQTGVMGCKPDPVKGWVGQGDWQIMEFPILVNTADAEAEENKQEREKILARLSEREKRILGLL